MGNGKKIVLLQPKAGEWDLAGLRPPDSLLAVAALPHQEGYPVRIIDQRVDRNWKQTLRKDLKDALLFGTTSMTGPQIRYALEASRVVKAHSDVPVVWGGVHVSLMPEQSLTDPSIDMIAQGEGDFLLLDLVRCLEQNGDLGSIPGLFYKKDGRIIKNTSRTLIHDLDELPPLPYELVNLENYYGFNYLSGRSITLMTSRGCPFRCAFCYNTVYYKNRWRGMSVEKTLSLIRRAVNEFGVTSIFFQDDNFCANVKRFEAIVDGLLKENFRITWGLMGTRVSSIMAMSDELLEKAARAGCVDVDVGVESGSERILELISKDVKIAEVIETNKRLSRFFPKTKFTFIMGIPTETEAELMQSVKFSLRLLADNPHMLPLFFTYTAYPGTRLYENALQEGLREPQNLEEWADINYETAYLNYPWLDKKRVGMIRNFQFTSMFATKNNEYKIRSKYLLFLARLYRPAARLRFKYNVYQYPLEMVAARMLSRLLRA